MKEKAASAWLRPLSFLGPPIPARLFTCLTREAWTILFSNNMWSTLKNLNQVQMTKCCSFLSQKCQLCLPSTNNYNSLPGRALRSFFGRTSNTLIEYDDQNACQEAGSKERRRGWLVRRSDAPRPRNFKIQVGKFQRKIMDIFRTGLVRADTDPAKVLARLPRTSDEHDWKKYEETQANFATKTDVKCFSN